MNTIDSNALTVPTVPIVPTLKEFFIACGENRLMEYVLAHKEYARQETPGAAGPVGGYKQYLLMREGIRRIDELLAAEYALRKVKRIKNVDDTK